MEEIREHWETLNYCAWGIFKNNVGTKSHQNVDNLIIILKQHLIVLLVIFEPKVVNLKTFSLFSKF